MKQVSKSRAVVPVVVVLLLGCSGQETVKENAQTAAGTRAPVDWSEVPVHADAQLGEGYLIDDSWCVSTGTPRPTSLW